MYRKAQYSILILILALVGCKTTEVHKADKTIRIMDKKFVTLKSAPERITAVTDSLNALFNEGGDMQAEFEAFEKDVNNLISLQGRFQKLKSSVDSSKNAFIEAWAERHLIIKSDELRTRSKERRAKVIARFNEVNQLIVEAKAEFEPWIQEVIDIRVYLESDLNSSGVASIADVASRTSENSESIKSKITNMIAELEKQRNEMTATKPAKKSATKPVKKSATKPVKKSDAEPATESATKPDVESATKLDAESATKPSDSKDK